MRNFTLVIHLHRIHEISLCNTFYFTKWDSTHLKSDDTKHQKTGKIGKTENTSLDKGEPWWLSLISYHVVSHSGWQPLPKITKGLRWLKVKKIFQK